jgi:hypothetical protein
MLAASVVYIYLTLPAGKLVHQLHALERAVKKA